MPHETVAVILVLNFFFYFFLKRLSRAGVKLAGARTPTADGNVKSVTVLR